MGAWSALQIQANDRRLLTAFVWAGLGCLGVGAFFAILMLLVRTPALALLPAGVYYQALTGHGVFMFILWLSFAQTGLLLAALLPLKRALSSYRLAWTGWALMVLSAVLALAAVLSGADVSYQAPAPLTQQYPAAWLVYLSFTVLALGMLLLALVTILTLWRAVGRIGSLAAWAAFFKEIPISSFAAVAGLLIAVPGLLMALKTFAPALIWSLGFGELDALDYRVNWHVAFHIYHYIPALTLVGVAYALVELCAGAGSVYPKPLAKGLFLLYPLLVPPTFLYHLLADPNIPQAIKSAGTTLSLLVGTPTLLHVFIIVGMLEARLRRAGPGVWLKRLPWSNPAFGSMAMGLVTLFVGGALSYLMLQEPLAAAFHNTFTVPAYVHAIAAGGANLLYMGALYYAVPLLGGRRLRAVGLARWQPYLMGAALLCMSLFGVGAGLAGALRRTPLQDGSATWSGWMNGSLGLGGGLALVALVAFLWIMVRSLFGARASSFEQTTQDLRSLPLAPATDPRTPFALVPPLVFVVGVLLLTALAFQFLRSVAHGG